MKTITIKQPYASLIAEGYKKYEFRTWKTKYRGEVLIHAGKSVDKAAMKHFEYLNLEYPKGCIIAKAIITDCVEINDKMKEKLKSENAVVYESITEDSSFRGYGFKIEDVEKISPIPAKGKLSFWDYEE